MAAAHKNFSKTLEAKAAPKIGKADDDLDGTVDNADRPKSKPLHADAAELRCCPLARNSETRTCVYSQATVDRSAMLVDVDAPRRSIALGRLGHRGLVGGWP